MNARSVMKKNYANYDKLVNTITNNLSNLDEIITDTEERQETIIEEIVEYDTKFYTKYSRFLQEGSWTSQDYIDDDYYYLDAQSVAYTSSRPQITYNISVLRISALEEFKNKTFHLGDISFVQDTEFFGFMSDGFTPYKEKVLVTEITSNFDSPEKDSFKV